MENKDIRKSKLVFDMRVARKLIHMGCNVIDIKPLKIDRNRTVIVFEDTSEFQKAFEEITTEFKAKDDMIRIQKNSEYEQLSFED